MNDSVLSTNYFSSDITSTIQQLSLSMKPRFHLRSINTLIYVVIFAVTQLTGLLLSLSICFVLQDFIGGFIRVAMINSFILGDALIGSCILYQKLLPRMRPVYAVPISFFLLLGIGIISFVILLYSSPTMFIYYNRGLLSFLFIDFLFILSLFTITAGLITYRELLLEKEQTINREQTLKNRMEMQLLASKVNPHFLFNTLNMILSLLKHPQKAEDAILNLSDLLRYSLEQSSKPLIPIEQEIDHVKKYLELQKMRFGDKLEYVISGNGSFVLPPLLLQPLVENSIKHNIKEVAHLSVTISAETNDTTSSITVADSEKKVNTAMLNKGQGLTLTKKRVENTGGTFSIEDGGIRISLSH
jgi:two-component system, LytTR family, sensor kinase